MNLLRLVKSDFLKMRRTSFYSLHIIMPLIGIIVFLYYFSYSTMTPLRKFEGYLESLSIVFPTLIGVLTANIVKVELNAGKYKEVLGNKNGRFKPLLSKVIILLICGFTSLTIAVIGLYLGLKYILNQYTISINLYVICIFILFSCEIFLYILHLFISFQFGSMVSISIGVFESILSALMLTGQGDRVWQFIPSAWGVRLPGYYIYYFIGDNNNLQLQLFYESVLAIKVVLLFTCALLVILSIWFNFFEPKMEN